MGVLFCPCFFAGWWDLGGIVGAYVISVFFFWRAVVDSDGELFADEPVCRRCGGLLLLVTPRFGEPYSVCRGRCESFATPPAFLTSDEGVSDG